MAFSNAEGYKLINKSWNKCLDLQADGDGTNPNVWGYAHHPNQDWYLEKIEGNLYKIKNKAWNMYLNLQSNENGANPNVWGYAAHPDQEWYVEEIRGNLYKLKNKSWNVYLNLQANENGAIPNVWEYAEHPDQEWYLERADEKQSLMVDARREFAQWIIDREGVVTSRITYTVGSGTGSKRYYSAVVVEFEDGQIYTAEATKTVGRPLIGSSKGTAENHNHPALPVDKVSSIRRVYIKAATDSSGPRTIREWVDTVKGWVMDAGKIYRELKDTDLVKDGVKYMVGS